MPAVDVARTLVHRAGAAQLLAALAVGRTRLLCSMSAEAQQRRLAGVGPAA
jgi:hypothetical protein